MKNQNEKIKKLYFNQLSKLMKDKNETTVLINEIDAITLPEDANDAAKIMDEKYGYIIKMYNSCKVQGGISGINAWVTFFGIIYLLGILAVLMTYANK